MQVLEPVGCWLRHAVKIGKQYKSRQTIGSNISPIFTFQVEKTVAPIPVLLEPSAGPLLVGIPSDTRKIQVRRVII